MKTAKALVVALVAVVLSACATAPGPKFSGLGAPKDGLGDIYLYRTDAFAASGAGFEVMLDGKKVGDIYNASYLHLQLAPGSYFLKVSPHALAKSSELQIQVEAGRRKFFQYDFTSGPLYNPYFIGSSIEPREEALALNELKNLNSAR